ncbi:glycosyltransferase family 4 protein [Alkalihalobacterium elongatum]|uniref:glycosyltransferase family 4 protein n=1 Tax=Alkalihalobacterium elongatum TaxID=2675466 RepID=UPI001C1FA37D|nr:glycosyltransferase family 4 protein [Alkalihalobacterium elongatum]
MKILVLSNLGMGLYKFRRELLDNLLSQGHKVYVSLPNDKYVTKLEEMGCKFIETHVDRRGTNPYKDSKLLLNYIKMIKEIKPDIVLTYTIKPNVYGGLACRITKTPYITNITGLGTAMENKGLVSKLTILLYKWGLKASSCIFFQNENNRNFFVRNSIVKNKTRLIPGSGVNLKEHRFEEYPRINNPISFLFIGRIMKAKGVEELFEAAIKVKEKYPNIQFDLVGACEEDYTERLAKLTKKGIVKYHGQQDDVHSFIKDSYATILPSYHEGTANVLLESAATGRPILASKVPGCIETFDEGISGFGFKVRNVDSLVECLIKFIELEHNEKKIMGINGRSKVEREFDRLDVVGAYTEEINQLKKLSLLK